MIGFFYLLTTTYDLRFDLCATNNSRGHQEMNRELDNKALIELDEFMFHAPM